jgi:spore coat polysaccharide biosynthesis protein SpsF
MEALKTVPCDVHILACPWDCLVPFAPLAERAGFEIFGGSKEDVLNRYCSALRYFKADRFIRATGDNPFVFADAAAALNQEAAALGADYAGYSGLPYGAGVESVSAEALFQAEREAAAIPEREHVCPYLYNNPGRFLLHRPLAPLKWQGPFFRFTVDTWEDYERAQFLYEFLNRELPGEDRYRGETIIKAFLYAGVMAGEVP